MSKKRIQLKTVHITSTPEGLAVPIPLITPFCYSCNKPGKAVICFKLFMIEVYCVLWRIHFFIFDLFYWWWKPQYSMKTTDLPQKLGKYYHTNPSRVKPVTVMEWTTLIARDTDYTCRCQWRLFVIAATTIPSVHKLL